jgi:hypothetical protein
LLDLLVFVAQELYNSSECPGQHEETVVHPSITAAMTNHPLINLNIILQPHGEKYRGNDGIYKRHTGFSNSASLRAASSRLNGRVGVALLMQ